MSESRTTPRRAPGPPIDISVVVTISGTDEVDLGGILSAVSRELAREGRSCEFVFVDDGVGPAIDAELAELTATGARVKIVRFHQRFGEAVALTAGFEQSEGAVIVTTAPYLQVGADEFNKLLAKIDEGYDYVSGWRHQRVDPFLNRLQSRTFNLLVRLVTRVKLHDLNCALRAMRRQVLDEISLYGDLYRFLPILADRHGFKVTEVSVKHREEKGKIGFFGFGVYVRRFLDMLTMLFLTKFTKRPLRFFGLLGSFFFVLGVGINAYLTLVKVIAGDSLADRPLLILGVLLMVMGIQLISIGLLGEIIIFTHAKDIKEHRVEGIIEEDDDEDGTDDEEDREEEGDDPPREDGGHPEQDEERGSEGAGLARGRSGSRKGTRGREGREAGNPGRR